MPGDWKVGSQTFRMISLLQLTTDLGRDRGLVKEGCSAMKSDSEKDKMINPWEYGQTAWSPTYLKLEVLHLL